MPTLESSRRHLCIKNASDRAEAKRFGQYRSGTRHRENPYYIGLLSSHTERPGPLIARSNPAGARIFLILQGFFATPEALCIKSASNTEPLFTWNLADQATKGVGHLCITAFEEQVTFDRHSDRCMIETLTDDPDGNASLRVQARKSIAHYVRVTSKNGLL